MVTSFLPTRNSVCEIMIRAGFYEVQRRQRADCSLIKTVLGSSRRMRWNNFSLFPVPGGKLLRRSLRSTWRWSGTSWTRPRSLLLPGTRYEVSFLQSMTWHSSVWRTSINSCFETCQHRGAQFETSIWHILIFYFISRLSSWSLLPLSGLIDHLRSAQVTSSASVGL